MVAGIFLLIRYDVVLVFLACSRSMARFEHKHVLGMRH